MGIQGEEEIWWEYFKARLWIKGFSQAKGIDFNETFSPTIYYDSIRVPRAVAVQRKYSIEQFDIVPSCYIRWRNLLEITKGYDFTF